MKVWFSSTHLIGWCRLCLISSNTQQRSAAQEHKCSFNLVQGTRRNFCTFPKIKDTFISRIFHNNWNTTCACVRVCVFLNSGGQNSSPVQLCTDPYIKTVNMCVLIRVCIRRRVPSCGGQFLVCHTRRWTCWWTGSCCYRFWWWFPDTPSAPHRYIAEEHTRTHYTHTTVTTLKLTCCSYMCMCVKLTS